MRSCLILMDVNRLSSSDISIHIVAALQWQQDQHQKTLELRWSACADSQGYQVWRGQNDRNITDLPGKVREAMAKFELLASCTGTNGNDAHLVPAGVKNGCASVLARSADAHAGAHHFSWKCLLVFCAAMVATWLNNICCRVSCLVCACVNAATLSKL